MAGSDGATYHVQAGDLRLDLSAAGGLLSLQTGGRTLAQTAAPGAPLWRLLLVGADGERQVDAGQAAACVVEQAGDGLRLTWRQIDKAAGMAVSASITPEDGRLLFRLSVDSLSSAAPLWRAEFPVIGGAQPLATGSEARLLVPRAGGYVVSSAGEAVFGLRRQYDQPAWPFDSGPLPPDSAADQVGVSFPYPGGLTMQFIAYYKEDSDGLILFTQDNDGYYKRFAARSSQAQPWQLSVEHYPGDPPLAAGGYAPGYAVALAGFRGDWNDAAAVYQQWALDQPALRLGPLHTRTDMPPWLMETGLWVWNRGPSQRVLPGVKRLQEMVGAPLALDWYWWHHTPYDTDFPDYLPPREGEEQFAAAVRRLHEDGLHAITYINGRLWGTSAPSWAAQNALAAACKKADGDYYHEVYNVFNNAELAPMCPTTALWQETVHRLVDELVNRYGLDGVYIDQIGISTPRVCFDTGHGHKAGGGAHWRQGYRQLMEGVREAAAGRPDAFFPTEGSCDMYLDLFHGFLLLDNSFERMGFYTGIGLNWAPVPLFAAVYHAYALHFGSYATLVPPPYDELWPQPAGPVRSTRYRERDFSDAFYAELGRAFVSGAQPMIANVYEDELADPELQPHWRFLRDLVQTRLAARDFLLYGSWQKPPRLAVPEVEVDFLVRGIYTPPENEHVLTRPLPAVLCSLWRAPDGRWALALANISRAAQRVRWQDHRLPPGAAVQCITGAGITGCGKVQAGGLVWEGDIPARSVMVLSVG